MKKAFDDYTFLAGSQGMKGSLWQGPDHLLVIEGRGFLLPYSEHYKRIDYKNVQALTLTVTSGWIWINLLLGLLFLFFAGIATLALMNEEGPVGYILMVPAATLFIGLIYHLSLGKSCRCALQTAVQILPLRPLNRLKKAEAALARIGQICREHQGEMPAAETLANEPMPGVLPAHQSAALSGGSKEIWKGSPWVFWTGISTVLWGGLIAGELFVPGVAYSIIQIAVWLPVFVLLLISLVRVSRYVSPGRLTFSLWATMALQIVLGIALYLGVIISSVIAEESNEGGSSGQGFMDSLVNLSMAETGMWGLLIVLCGVFIMALGLIMVSAGKSLIKNSIPAAAVQRPIPAPAAGTAPPLPTIVPSPVQPPAPPVASTPENPV